VKRICFDPVPEYAGSCIVESVDALALAEAVSRILADKLWSHVA